MKLLTCLLFLLPAAICQAQYRNDNVKFKTVSWEDLCQQFKANPGYTVIDVRSKGEFDDTSSFKNQNIGHVKEAVNMDIRELPNRLKEIGSLKDKPVFLYCSHSQRSRRAAKLLADSGFTKVYNINAGLSHFYLAGISSCPQLETGLRYNLVSPYKFINSKKQQYFVLDVRSDSAYQGISTDERKNAMGRITTATHIPLARLEQSLSKLPAGKPILIVDESGLESVKAAEFLVSNGFKHVNVLFNGMEALHQEIPEDQRTSWENSVAYHTINAETLNELAVNSKEVFIVDLRSRDEFSNLSKDSWRNIGNIRGAVNIPASEWNTKMTSLPSDTGTPVVLYSFSTSPEVFETARKLSMAGYRNVYVLMGGLFNLRWKAANLKGRSVLADWAVNIPPDNL